VRPSIHEHDPKLVVETYLSPETWTHLFFTSRMASLVPNHMTLPSPQATRVNTYDIMRGMAILGVVLAHTVKVFSSGNNTLDLLESYGRFGVQLFFFVSALTMCLMWQRRKDERYQTLNFFIRRFARIAPLFWLAIFVYYSNDLSLFKVLSTITFLHGLWPTTINAVVPGGWTIAAEMMFYACFPAIIKRMKDNVHGCILSGFTAYLFNMIIISPLIRLFCAAHTSLAPQLVEDFLYMNFFNQLPVFLLGCALYFLGPQRPNKYAILIMAVWFIVSLSRCLMGYDERIERVTLVTLIGFPLIFVFLQSKTKGLFPTLFSQLGKCSYPIYLSHFLIISLVTDIFKSFDMNPVGLGPNIAVYVAVLGLSYSAAVLLSKFIEYPTHLLAEYLVEKSEHRYVEALT